MYVRYVGLSTDNRLCTVKCYSSCAQCISFSNLCSAAVYLCVVYRDEVGGHARV